MTADDRLLLVLAILVGNGLATATNLAAVRLYCGAPLLPAPPGAAPRAVIIITEKRRPKGLEQWCPGGFVEEVATEEGIDGRLPRVGQVDAMGRIGQGGGDVGRWDSERVR